MANTYSQINIHCVFAVKGRDNIISVDFRDQLRRYISGILKNDNAFPSAVGGWKDHVHVFFELLPSLRISDLLRDLKATSSKWIYDNQIVGGRFQWQEGYGAFSHSRSQRHEVISYIINQEAHHQVKTFREEYLELLTSFEIGFSGEYLFEFYD